MSKEQYQRLIPRNLLDLPLQPPTAIAGHDTSHSTTTTTTANAASTPPPRPLPQEVLADLSASLQNPAGAGPSTTTKEFIALCHYNINPGLDGSLRGLTGAELQHMSAQVTLGIRTWLSKRTTSPPATPSDNSDASGNNAGRIRGTQHTRSTTATKRCATRDGNKCAITKQAEPIHVAHIFPLTTGPRNSHNASTNCDPLPPFLQLLELFAGPDVMRNVSNYLTEPNEPRSRTKLKTNRLENLLTLYSSLHSYLDGGKILLEPIGDPLSIFDSDTNSAGTQLTSYDIRFSFLPSHRPPSASTGWDHTSIVQAEPIGSLQYRECDDPLLNEIAIVRRLNQSQDDDGPRWGILYSGTVITLATDDPIRRPLPHPDLLRLHAALSKVVRCSGAAAQHGLHNAFDQDSEDDVVGGESCSTSEFDEDEEQHTTSAAQVKASVESPLPPPIPKSNPTSTTATRPIQIQTTLQGKQTKRNHPYSAMEVSAIQGLTDPREKVWQYLSALESNQDPEPVSEGSEQI